MKADAFMETYCLTARNASRFASDKPTLMTREPFGLSRYSLRGPQSQALYPFSLIIINENGYE